MQPNVPLSKQRLLLFVKESDLSMKLASYFANDSSLDDLNQGEVISKEADFDDHWLNKVNFVESCKSDFDNCFSDINFLVDLVANYIFVLPSKYSGGGSTSAALGVMWIDPRTSWTKQDIFEYFTHELTHQLMFLDEYIPLVNEVAILSQL